MMTLLLALTMSAAIQAQEIEKVDKFTSGYINGVYMGEAKFKTIDGVLYAVGYEGTRDWILSATLLAATTTHTLSTPTVDASHVVPLREQPI